MRRLAILTLFAIALPVGWAVVGPGGEAFATISSTATGKKTPVGNDAAAPIVGVRIEADSKSTEPLIRVAPLCSRCYYRWFDGG